MTNEEQVNDRFPRDIANHEMKVEIDDGVHRSILFTDHEDSYTLHFRIITWPGQLCISGDMGCYVFSRNDDMFQWFRSQIKHTNYDYVSQKCVGVCETDGMTKFSEQGFRDYIEGERIFRLEEHGEESDEVAELDNLLECSDDINSVDEAMSRCDGILSLYDVDARTFECLTYRFLWNVKAIIWGIQQYDSRVIAVERQKEVETAIYEMRNTRELFENIRIGTFFTLQSSCTVFRKIDEENAVDCDEDDYKMKGDDIVIPIYP